MEIVVIGAGASGLMAAIQAAASGARVTVLDGIEKPLKKLLTTGNGRCNLTNLSAGHTPVYRGRNPGLAEGIVKAFPPGETLAFFESIGLFCTERDGGLVYPRSGQAASVLDCLLREAVRRRVRLKYRQKVSDIRRDGQGFLVETEDWRYPADRVILSCGSKAAPVTGSDGSGLALAGKLGHKTAPFLPALVALKTKETLSHTLDGVRMPARISISASSEETVLQEAGELQWTGYGISGIAVFQLSRFAVNALEAGKQVTARIDLLPDIPVRSLMGSVEKILNGSFSGTNEELLEGIFPKKAVPFLIRTAGVPAKKPADTNAMGRLLETASNVRLTVTGSKGFEAAQCCSGGVLLTEIFPRTMESRLVPGLYMTGELLDADGPCGGDILQWAWTTGFLAGKHAGGNV